MDMKTKIEVENRKEAELIRRGLERPDVRAFVKIMGALEQLPTDRARRRVMTYVADKLGESAGWT
jgi:hypothetical protein